MIDLPSLLPYYWITKVEVIFRDWMRRVIKSSLVGDHLLHLLFCSVFSWREADSDGCRCFLVFCSLVTELAKLPKIVGLSLEENETDLQLQGCNKGVAEGPPTPIKSAAKGAPKMAWHSYQTGADHPEASIYEPLLPMNKYLRRGN
jgi:hypothetical protein